METKSCRLETSYLQYVAFIFPPNTGICRYVRY